MVTPALKILYIITNKEKKERKFPDMSVILKFHIILCFVILHYIVGWDLGYKNWKRLIIKMEKNNKKTWPTFQTPCIEQKNNNKSKTLPKT